MRTSLVPGMHKMAAEGIIHQSYISREFTDVFCGFRVGLLQVVFQHISGDVHEHPDIHLEVIWICWDLGDILESGLTMLPSFQHRL